METVVDVGPSFSLPPQKKGNIKKGIEILSLQKFSFYHKPPLSLFLFERKKEESPSATWEERKHLRHDVKGKDDIRLGRELLLVQADFYENIRIRMLGSNAAA